MLLNISNETGRKHQTLPLAPLLVSWGVHILSQDGFLSLLCQVKLDDINIDFVIFCWDKAKTIDGMGSCRGMHMLLQMLDCMLKFGGNPSRLIVHCLNSQHCILFRQPETCRVSMQSTSGLENPPLGTTENKVLRQAVLKFNTDF